MVVGPYAHCGMPDRSLLLVAPQAVLHVGDDAALDVVGALAVGMQTVWVNRAEHLWTQEQHPHASVADMLELCDLLGRRG